MSWIQSPSSISRARNFSSAAVSRETRPIARRYRRTGSSFPPPSSAPSLARPAPAPLDLRGLALLGVVEQRFDVDLGCGGELEGDLRDPLGLAGRFQAFGVTAPGGRVLRSGGGFGGLLGAGLGALRQVEGALAHRRQELVDGCGQSTHPFILRRAARRLRLALARRRGRRPPLGRARSLRRRGGLRPSPLVNLGCREPAIEGGGRRYGRQSLRSALRPWGQCQRRRNASRARNGDAPGPQTHGKRAPHQSRIRRGRWSTLDVTDEGRRGLTSRDPLPHLRYGAGEPTDVVAAGLLA